MMPRTPFAEDTAAHEVAAALGFSLAPRNNSVEVFDERSLPAEFKTSKPRPDYARIAAALHAGQTVEGARFRGMEYVLRPTGGCDE